MTDQLYVYGTAGVMIALFAWQVLSKRFDPFAPVWLFLVGYFHIYVIQAFSLRDYGLTMRGSEVLEAANFRAFWALVWFLLVYHCGPGRALAARLPTPPSAWSPGAVVMIGPFLIAWGLYCSWVVVTNGFGEDPSSVTDAETLFRSFPFMMFVGANLLIISGRGGANPRPALQYAGLAVAGLYVLIWTFNGKRSHSLIGVLSTVCALYVTRQKRPGWPVLLTTAFTGAMVVALAIGWRNNANYERSLTGFVQYLGDFRVASILKSLNIDEEDEDDPLKAPSYETLEYGGYLLMIDTVPERSDYDFGANYLRCVSTFIPRMFWPDKPLYGRDKWIGAWKAGSERKREDDFAGPAIGILGATQLNGGGAGTLVVLAVLGVLLRTAYEFFRRYETFPWVQAWWSLSYYNAWFMTVNDDPMVWFYYSWGVTCLPSLSALWLFNKLLGAHEQSVAAPAPAAA